MTLKVTVRDEMLDFLKAKLDIPRTIREYFPEWEGAGPILCPFHSDTTPSLSISFEGQAKCHGCDFVAANVVELVSKTVVMSYAEARQMLYEEVVNAVDPGLVARMRQLLFRRKGALAYLTGKRRGLHLDTVKDFQLGYEPSSGRITVPVFDSFGSCVNIRRFGWKKEHKNKVLNLKGHGEVRLFPEERLTSTRKVVLVEGEWDAMIGWQVGLPCFTWTGGAGSWNTDYEWLLNYKQVFLLYDNDEAGWEGQAKAEHRLERMNLRSLQVGGKDFDIPPIEEGKDLTDWVMKSTWAEFFAADVKAYQPVKKYSRKRLCPYCGQTLPKGFKGDMEVA